MEWAVLALPNTLGEWPNTEIYFPKAEDLLTLEGKKGVFFQG